MRLHLYDFIFLAGFVVYVIIRAVFEKRTRNAERTLRRMERQEIVLLWIVGIGNVLLPVLYWASPWLSLANYDLPRITGPAGVLVLVASQWLFWKSHADLGMNWSVTLELRKDHQLVTQGIYRTIRHPMYAAIWLTALAQGLLLHNWLAGWAGVATFAVMYFLRVPREEQMMRESFGQEYEEYMQRTGRLWPRLAGRRNP